MVYFVIIIIQIHILNSRIHLEYLSVFLKLSRKICLQYNHNINISKFAENKGIFAKTTKINN